MAVTVITVYALYEIPYRKQVIPQQAKVMSMKKNLIGDERNQKEVESGIIGMLQMRNRKMN